MLHPAHEYTFLQVSLIPLQHRSASYVPSMGEDDASGGVCVGGSLALCSVQCWVVCVSHSSRGVTGLGGFIGCTTKVLRYLVRKRCNL